MYNISLTILNHIHTHISIDEGRERTSSKKKIYIHTKREERACVCVCAREGGGERERGKKKRERIKWHHQTLLQRLCMLLAFCSVQTRVETFATRKKRREGEEEEEKNTGIRIDPCVWSALHWFARMDRRLHAVQDRLAEHCAQTFKTVQGSVSAVTSVSRWIRTKGHQTKLIILQSVPIFHIEIVVFLLLLLVFSKRNSHQTWNRSWIIISTCIYSSI